ncbi:hypothetical protein C8A03DRAFT_38310 [Achaetomium macrosporum]|uniref:Uncharacterized protein n=1 Tax=Achaetomium macrosporum TaxID=79813 RepID=A0AAN7HAK8_9PEZI|nr:hypothetical protein C8A03DRAFT_38310 [Achaetomium macrosporum]
MREHHHTPLYVHPIVWTSGQVRLLGCHFAPKEPRMDRNGQSDAKPAAEQVSTAPQRSQQKQRYQELIWNAAIYDSLKRSGYRAVEFNAGFRFGQHTLVPVPTNGLFWAPSIYPFLAYVNYEAVEVLRSKRFAPWPGSRDSAAAAKVRDIMLRAVQPPNKAEDPYIAAILIAMAQEQQILGRVAASEGAPSSPTQSTASEDTDSETSSQEDPSFEVRVLVAPNTAPQFLSVYSASVPSSFLAKLEWPSRFSPSPPLQIAYRQVPFSPSGPERLRDLLPRVIGMPSGCEGSDASDAAEDGQSAEAPASPPDSPACSSSWLVLL